MLIVLLGIFLIIHTRQLATTDHRPRSLKPGAILVIIGSLLFVNNIFFSSAYDQYSGDPGEGPYQAVIDFAADRGAMTFWAHPEVVQRTQVSFSDYARSVAINR